MKIVGTNELGETVRALKVIEDADLEPSQTLIAQIMWGIRQFLREMPPFPKPFQMWSVEEIIAHVRWLVVYAPVSAILHLGEDDFPVIRYGHIPARAV